MRRQVLAVLSFIAGCALSSAEEVPVELKRPVFLSSTQEHELLEVARVLSAQSGCVILVDPQEARRTIRIGFHGSPAGQAVDQIGKSLGLVARLVDNQPPVLILGQSGVFEPTRCHALSKLLELQWLDAECFAPRLQLELDHTIEAGSGRVDADIVSNRLIISGSQKALDLAGSIAAQYDDQDSGRLMACSRRVTQ